MTKQGAVDLYTYLSTAWVLVIKPGASEAWKTAKLREIYQTYKEYSDGEVMAAFQKWTAENDTFPTTKNIITEILFERARKRGKPKDERYFMERIDDNGTESVVMWDGKVSFTWDEFVNIPCNKDHIDPDEWARRLNVRRKQIAQKLRG